MSLIELVERGQPKLATISEGGGRALVEACIALQRAGVLNIQPMGNDTLLLTPKMFVGQYVSADVTIRVKPKSQAAFQALKDLNALFTSRIVETYELHRILGADTEDAVLALVLALDDFLREDAPPWTYQRTKVITSAPRGKIRFSETSRTLAARGVQHAVVCMPSRRQQDRDLCALLATASVAAVAQGTDQSSLVALRHRAGRFDRAEILSLGAAMDSGRTLMRQYADRMPVIRVVMRALEVIVRDASVAAQIIPMPAGVAHFSNLEAMWENAVYQLMLPVLPLLDADHCKLHPLRGAGVSVLRDGGPHIDPDVIAFNDSRTRVVVDAKYKQTETALADDVYQMIAYLDRLSAPSGLLVYIGEQGSRLEILGRSSAGALVGALWIDPADIHSERQNLLLKHGLLAPLVLQSPAH